MYAGKSGPIQSRGIVYLAGAGPGDPNLITIAAKEALSRADVVVYDRLAHPRLLRYAPTHAELIFAGKMADRHTMTQDEINATLAQHAAADRVVVRLKGGDPFVFGRGGEEAEYLRERGISFVVIPGISSAIAAPAYAGIPVTHRDDSSSFAVITGHERAEARESGERAPGEAEQRRRWDHIAHAADTLIFLMGVDSIGEIAAQLIRNGRSPGTPVAMVRWGTWAGRQETLTATLANIAQRVKETSFKAPAVTVVGDVVRRRERLRWWDNRPLSGRSIVVTRAREQASSLVEQLERLGARTIEFPTIKIMPPPDDYAALDNTVGKIGEYDWIVFSSSNAVDVLLNRLHAAGKDSRSLHGIELAAVGAATAERLASKGLNADFVPTSFTGEDAALQIPLDAGSASRILVPGAAESTEALVRVLTQRGASVDMVAAYATVPDIAAADEVQQALQADAVDAVTFTSSSTVKNFVEALGGAITLSAAVTIACIGPTTAQTARDFFKREPQIIAQRHTVEGLVDALTAHYAGV